MINKALEQSETASNLMTGAVLGAGIWLISCQFYDYFSSFANPFTKLTTSSSDSKTHSNSTENSLTPALSLRLDLIEGRTNILEGRQNRFEGRLSKVEDDNLRSALRYDLDPDLCCPINVFDIN